MANYSLGEIDALARKATRGAGYSWGIAEEAGKSVRWLSAYGFQGCEILAQFLTVVANKPHQFMPNLNNGESIQAETATDHGNDNDNGNLTFKNNVSDKNDAPLCALYAGTLINDLGHQLNQKKSLSFDNMLSPLLALSQAGRVAEAFEISISFKYAVTIIICNPTGILITDLNNNQLKDSSVERSRNTPPLYGNMFDDSFDVVCKRIEGKSQNTHFPSPQSRPISADALKILEKFAHETYAPATEESRLKGAG